VPAVRHPDTARADRSGLNLGAGPVRTAWRLGYAALVHDDRAETVTACGALVSIWGAPFILGGLAGLVGGGGGAFVAVLIPILLLGIACVVAGVGLILGRGFGAPMTFVLSLPLATIALIWAWGAIATGGTPARWVPSVFMGLWLLIAVVGVVVVLWRVGVRPWSIDPLESAPRTRRWTDRDAAADRAGAEARDAARARRGEELLDGLPTGPGIPRGGRDDVFARRDAALRAADIPIVAGLSAARRRGLAVIVALWGLAPIVSVAYSAVAGGDVGRLGAGGIVLVAVAALALATALGLVRDRPEARWLAASIAVLVGFLALLVLAAFAARGFDLLRAEPIVAVAAVASAAVVLYSLVRR
jgi:hypothetical protein